MRHKGPPIRLTFGLILLLATVQSGCDSGPRSTTKRGPTGPPGSNFHVIVHTDDGRHLWFDAGSFRPSAIEHCRADGQRHLTTIYELTQLWPGGHGFKSLCPDLSGSFMMLRLVFPDQPALKVSTMCPDGCAMPGGYYPPLGLDVSIPWSEILYIEFRPG